MLHLAKRYGISNVGLAKICRKHDIPRPPRGHWAKLQFGKASPQTPLPHADEDCAIEMREPLESREDHVAPPSPQPPVGKACAKKHVDPKIIVAETLRNAHELVNRAKHQLQNATTDENALIVVPEDSVLDICVSKGRLHRALLLIDALLKAAEERGHRVAKGPNIEVQGIAIPFGIKEQLRTIQDEQPEEPDLEAGHYAFGHSRFKKRTSPSGRLVLSLADGVSYWRCRCRRSWSDGIRPVEDYLNSVLRNIIDLAVHESEFQAEKQRQEQERRQQERRRAELRDLFKAERSRVDSLLRQAENWRKSRDLRGYIEASRQKHLADSGATEPSGEFGKWIDWATQQADRLDPLTESPPSILDEDMGEDDECAQGFSRSRYDR
jgi:hypothetical protein